MSKADLEKLAAAIDAEVARLARCRGLIRRVDSELLRNGHKHFETEVEFARWLAAPLPLLKGRAPIDVMFARDGKSLVLGVLLTMCKRKQR